MNAPQKYLVLIKMGQIVLNDKGNFLTLPFNEDQASVRKRLMDAYHIHEFPHSYLLRTYDSLDEIPKPDDRSVDDLESMSGGSVIDLEGTVDYDKDI